jgi:hypothetical protein
MSTETSDFGLVSRVALDAYGRVGFKAAYVELGVRFNVNTLEVDCEDDR